MGAVKKFIGGVFGGSAPKAAPVAAPVAAPAAVAPVETEEERQKKAKLALNAGDLNPSSPLGVTAPATVTKRNLLGL